MLDGLRKAERHFGAVDAHAGDGDVGRRDGEVRSGRTLALIERAVELQCQRVIEDGRRDRPRLAVGVIGHRLVAPCGRPPHPVGALERRLTRIRRRLIADRDRLIDVGRGIQSQPDVGSVDSHRLNRRLSASCQRERRYGRNAGDRGEERMRHNDRQRPPAGIDRGGVERRGWIGRDVRHG